MNWKEEDGRLVKAFEADSFSDICKKLQDVAQVADEMDHHPDFEVFGYKHIRFRLFTHSKDSITELDHQLAQKIDSFFG